MNVFDAADALETARAERDRADRQVARALKDMAYTLITTHAPEATHVSVRVFSEDENTVLVDWLDLSGADVDTLISLPDEIYDRVVGLIDELLDLIRYDDPIAPLVDSSQEPQPLSIFLER